jgi:hypothetical protein
VVSTCMLAGLVRDVLPRRCARGIPTAIGIHVGARPRSRL